MKLILVLMIIVRCCQTFSQIINRPSMPSLPVPLSNNKICDQLLRKTDDLSGMVTIFSNDMKNIDRYEFIKNISKEGEVSYELYMSAKGPNYTTEGKGIHILFDDSTQFSKPDIPLEVKVGGHLDYEYWAYIPLTLAELEMFIRKSIKNIRVYTYDLKVENYRSDLIICLKSSR